MPETDQSGTGEGMKFHLKEKFKNFKLSKKMLLVYSFFAGISCIISMIALQMCLNIYDGKLYEKSLQELDFFTQQVNESMKEIEELSTSIAMSRDVQEQLAQMKGMEYMSAEYAMGLYQLRELIGNELYLHPAVKNVLYIDGHGSSTKAGMDTGTLREETQAGFLEECSQARGGYVTRNPEEGYPYFLSGRDILETKNASLHYLGTLIFTSDLATVIQERNNDLEAAHSSLFVYSEDGMIYQEEKTVPQLPSLGHDKGYEIIRTGGEKYFMCYLKSSASGWMYVNIFPYTEIFGQTMAVRYLLLGGFVILFLAILVAMKKTSVIITKPLNQLTESMQIVERGDFKGAKLILSQDTQNDETGLLAQEFQVMLDKIDRLIHENYEKQLLIKDTSYKMLQAQINPHFLYNTLNTLNWMVKGKRSDDAGKVIMELGKLLRASFAKDPYTTVEDELETAKGYITIQQYRYQSRAEFIVEAEGNLSGYMMPRMILQPLIENAIYYGVDTSLDRCRVMVSVTEEEDTILLAVMDTGRGMDPEELKAVRNGTVKPKGHGIGLKNIRERLDITYEGSEFVIESDIGEGTKVYIRIPKVKSEVPHV